MSDLICRDCPAPITVHSKTGRCRSCVGKFNRNDPVMNANRMAALRVKKRTPECRATQRAARLKLLEDRKDDPVWQEYLRQQGKRLYADLVSHPDAIARRTVTAGNAARRRADKLLAWCPDGRRAEYQKLRKAVGAAEARRMIEADMTPFERQLARVRAGAALVTVKPLRRADHAFTLGGVAPEAM